MIREDYVPIFSQLEQIGRNDPGHQQGLHGPERYRAGFGVAGSARFSFDSSDRSLVIDRDAAQNMHYLFALFWVHTPAG